MFSSRGLCKVEGRTPGLQKTKASDKENSVMTLRNETRVPLSPRAQTDVNRRMLRYLAPGALLIVAFAGFPGASQPSQDIASQIFDLMSQTPGVTAGHRVLHPKGIVCQGTFEASPGAVSISRAAHFRGRPVPVTVRLSDGSSDIAIPDASPDASPRGMAIRFLEGAGTDIVANSHNGFIVGTPEDFLALQKALAATDPSKPHPWAIETFLGAHPSALKFVQNPGPVPASFATESFYGNNAFLFVGKDGQKRAGRYQIVPVAGPTYFDDATAKAQPPNFLVDELKARLAKAPSQFNLFVQVAGPGDPTDDSTMVWPDDRKRVDMGVITITSVVPDNSSAENQLAFDPTRLIDGIELSGDPLPTLRSRVYAIASATRRAQAAASERSHKTQKDR
jgi:catalase